MSYAAYGPLTFQVIASPTKLERSKKYKWEYLYVIGAPPIAQWIWDGERHIQLCITFHQLWCDPQTALDTLTQLAELHTPQALVFGNGQNLGNYVVIEMRDKMVWQADDGTIVATELEIELAEIPAVTAAVVNYPQDISVGNPPGLTTSQVASLGSTLVVSPATAAPAAVTGPVSVSRFTTVANQLRTIGSALSESWAPGLASSLATLEAAANGWTGGTIPAALATAGAAAAAYVSGISSAPSYAALLTATLANSTAMQAGLNLIPFTSIAASLIAREV
jgi:phage protein U